MCRCSLLATVVARVVFPQPEGPHNSIVGRTSLYLVLSIL